MKEKSERLGNGHALHELLTALKKVIYDLDQVHIVFMDETNKVNSRTRPAKAKGKNKKKKGHKKREHRRTSTRRGKPFIRFLWLNLKLSIQT